jgi:DNA-binding CsgD family transcriptional regulator
LGAVNGLASRGGPSHGLWAYPSRGLSTEGVRPTVGRDAELELVDRFLERVPGGTPILVIDGDPGIGKTTVWLEAIRRAEARSFRLLKASPAESEAELPFAAFGDLVGEAFAEVGSALPAPQERALATALLLADIDEPADARTTATAAVSLVTTLAGEGPVVVAIDDMQWLDAASERVLAFAARRLPENAAVLLSGRSEPLEKLPLGLTGAEDRVDRLRLGRLSLAALHNLITSRLGISLARPVLVRVAAASAGNPFFALEMARALKNMDANSFTQPLPVPSNLRELVAGHVRGLSATAWEAVTVAAALSRPSFSAIIAALGSEATALATLAEAEDAGVVVLEGDRIRFVHPLLASGIYGSLSSTRRRQLHRRLAPLTDDPEERARHLALSETEPGEGTAEQLEAAGRHAALRGAHEAAGELFSAACRLTPTDQPLKLARRMLEQGSASLVTGNLEGARKVATEAVETAPVASMRAEALVLLSDTAWVEGLSRLAGQYLEAALREAGDDRELAPPVLAKLVGVTSILDPARALSYSQAAMERLTEERHSRLLAEALFSHVWAEAMLGRRPQIELFDRGLALDARAGPNVRPSFMPLIWYNSTDDFEAARARHEVEHRWYREHGDEPAVAERLTQLGLVELRAGRWDMAERYLEQSFTTMEQFVPDGRSAGPWFAPGHIRALMDAHRGRTARARATLVPMIEECQKGEQSFWAAILLSTLAFVEFAEARHEAVERTLTAMREHLEVLGAVEIPGIRSEQVHIESLLALGQLERAREILARLEARGRSFPRLWIMITLPRARALVAAGEGDLASAIGEMAGVDSGAARLLPFELARNLLVYGRLLRRAKQRRAAADALTDALAVFEQLGAPTWSAEARSELDRIGLRRAPQHLTVTERRVVELAARGMTNREVAAALFISPKTVEANLARAYGKLGVNSRAELGALAKEIGSTFSQT